MSAVDCTVSGTICSVFCLDSHVNRKPPFRLSVQTDLLERWLHVEWTSTRD